MLLAGVLAAAAPAAAQLPFRVYPSFEGESTEAPLPPDYQVPGELVVGKSSAPRERDAEKENARKRARRAQEKAWYEANKDRVMERQRQRRAARKAA